MSARVLLLARPDPEGEGTGRTSAGSRFETLPRLAGLFHLLLSVLAASPARGALDRRNRACSDPSVGT